MENQICLITGCNTGIGKVTAIELAKRGATIIMACRNQVKAERAKVEIIAQSQNPRIDLFLVDLSLQSSIRKFAEAVHKKYNKIDILINNAGAIYYHRYVTPEKIELTFAVNHLAYFLVTHLLLDLIKAAPQGRIINVASRAHQGYTIDFNDLMGEKNYSPFKAYGQSKLANIMFTYKLAEYLQGTKVTANCLHPGLVNTEFARDMPFWFRMIFTYLGLTPEKGAETTIYLATEPSLAGVTGKYFYKKKEAKTSYISYDKNIQQQLWDISLKLVGIHQF
ncbi:MAG: SDR family oxidoreductase [Bacteroidia bacterium]|nr:SDR family oxidoreductase [Bacteroidia bacterium]MDW8159680.1 SDR family oxidoreductase [Bacteroidia bacterium]